LKQILPQEPVLHVDETSLPVNRINYWLHVICTPLLTCFSVQKSRGKAAIHAIGIIPQFTGWLMHDFLSSYLSFENCLHTFCKSHLMRELIFIFEQHHQRWAKDLYDLFLEMLPFVQAQKARAAPADEAEYERWQRRYRKLLRAGRQLNPLTAAQVVIGESYPLVVLVIDEINRANMSRVFGELITLLEEDKRLGGREQLIVQLPNRPNSTFGVPKNLIIIGTMNTADKSLALLDLALRRRFEFHRLDPKPKKVASKKLEDFLTRLNTAIAKERKSLDYGIGHAYFMREGITADMTPEQIKEALSEILQRKIVPLLQEYFGGDDSKVVKILKAAGVELKTVKIGDRADRDLLIQIPLHFEWEKPHAPPTPPNART